MKEKIAGIREYIIRKEHEKYRVYKEFSEIQKDSGDFQGAEKYLLRKKERFCRILENENPVFIPNMRFVFIRTFILKDCIVNTKEEKELRNRYYLHEMGHVCNICPDYSEILNHGFDQILDKICSAEHMLDESEAVVYKRTYAKCLKEMTASIFAFVEKYAAALRESDRSEWAEAIVRIVHTGAKSFEEALQLLRLLHYLGWAEGEYHIGIGRLDQYLYPYYKKDIGEKRISEEEAFDMIEEFFLTFNIDNDLYPGVQMGDNGQSLMLGGIDEEGNDCFNELSAMCLRASCELKLIDPKINLRVSKKTGAEEYVEGTRLTKAGLGFPQYSNDDIVIPALERWGYSKADAVNYTVAACWEFIIPGRGMDIPNIGAVSFPKLINRCVEKYLKKVKDFDEFQEKVLYELSEEIKEITENVKPIFMFPAPYLSILMEGCVERLQDISEGCTYNNYGLHGAGLSCAVDSLYALKEYYFRNQKVCAEELIHAVREDFAGDSEYLQLVREEMPHMGDGETEVDQIGVWLLNSFAEILEGFKNERGGIYRAGTGSAMYYIKYAEELGASPDGRRRGEYFSANFSPSLFVRTKGPLSVIKSFTEPELMRVANGGPLTLEFHESVFRGEDGIQKVAALVQLFIERGGHQLQLNAINAETLKDAQKHPENYKNLIVRVWGWSAYFIELDKVYQDHLIQRAQYTV